MFEVAWKEFNRSDRIVVKRRAFKTEKARNSFIDKLFQKDNFFEIVGIR